MLKRHGLILSVALLVFLLLTAGCAAATGGAEGNTPTAPDAADTPATVDGGPLPGDEDTLPAGTETGDRELPPDSPVSSDDPTPPPAETPDADEEGEYAVSEAQVKSVDTMILESFPVQVRVHVQGWMGACDEILEPEVNREGNTFHVELKTRTLIGQVCTMQLLSFERTIPLDVVGLEAGEYVVDVNGVTTTFTLEVDNVLEVPADAE